jgi:two-component system copper resistance phosphate regulon response regulator CusR
MQLMTITLESTSTVTRKRILIVEDEPRIAGFLARGLTSEGAETTVARTGTEAIDHAHDLDANLVLLDLSLPGPDGLQVLRHWTEHRPEVPILILSASRDLATRLAGLRAGARDYVTKPFSFDELLERVRIHLRATGREGPGVMRSGATSYDPRTREVDFGGGPVPLSDRESRVFEHLLRERGSVVSRERLLSSVWGYSFRPDTNVVDVCIRRLRAKVGDERIETVRGAGYRLVG